MGFNKLEGHLKKESIAKGMLSDGKNYGISKIEYLKQIQKSTSTSPKKG